MVTLGKTGQKVPVLGMGTSWDVAPGFVQAALFAGVRYIDTSETYEDGNARKDPGRGARTDQDAQGRLPGHQEQRRQGRWASERCHASRSSLNASLERLRTDYIDCYYLHGVEGREIALLSDPDVKAAFEKLKKSGKIKFCGLSLPRSPGCPRSSRPPPRAAGSTRS